MTRHPIKVFNSQLLSSSFCSNSKLGLGLGYVIASTSFKIRSNSTISAFIHGWLSRNRWFCGRIHTVMRVKWDFKMTHWGIVWKLIGMWFILIVKELHELTTWSWWTWQYFHLYNDVSLYACLVSRIFQHHNTLKTFHYDIYFNKKWWRVIFEKSWKTFTILFVRNDNNGHSGPYMTRAFWWTRKEKCHKYNKSVTSIALSRYASSGSTEANSQHPLIWSESANEFDISLIWSWE